MLDPQGALYARLLSQVSFTNLMDTYTPPGGSSVTALFSSVMPSDHDLGPKVSGIIDAPFLNREDDTATDFNREVGINVRLYNAPDGSNLNLITAGEQARSVIKSWPSEIISGAEYQVASVTGPEAAPTTNPAADGLLLTVRLLIKES